MTLISFEISDTDINRIVDGYAAVNGYNAEVHNMTKLEFLKQGLVKHMKSGIAEYEARLASLSVIETKRTEIDAITVGEPA